MGYRESVMIKYDTNIISLDKLLFEFYNTLEEKLIAEKLANSIEDNKNLSNLGLVFIKFQNFYPAEEYYQDYYKKNPLRYKYYRYNSGRDQYIKSVWQTDDIATTISSFKKPLKEQLKNMLTPMQYVVTQNDKTEPPFKNEYNKKEYMLI